MAHADGSPDEPMEVQHEEEKVDIEQKLINEEYKIWKKNSVFIYDMMFSRALEWPTLTTQWFPDVKKAEGTTYCQHRLLFGTHTSDQGQNYLQIASVEIPDLQIPDTAEYDEQRGEIGGYGNAKRPFQFNIIQQINHPGEVNKARYEPQNPNVIASFCVDGKVRIFDRTKHSIKPRQDGTVQTELELEGHTKEGYGLSWNPAEQYKLATGSYDQTVKTWDVAAGFASGNKSAKALQTYTHHSAEVNDVQYHPLQQHWLGTVSDDLTFQLVDTRASNTAKAAQSVEAHQDAVNCLSWHPKHDTVFATGSADKTIALWDLRNIKTKLHIMDVHKDSVIALEWHPDNDAVLASSSYDRRILLWDVSKIGEEQTPDEAEDGPPELLFMHGGFTNRVTDFSWNKNDPWIMCAAAEDNQMQIFRPARSLVNTITRKVVQHQDVSD